MTPAVPLPPVTKQYWNLWYVYLPLLPIAPYGAGLGFPIVHKSCKPHPSQMKLARLIAWLKNGKLLKKIFCTVRSRKFQHAPANERAVYGHYVGVRRTMAVKLAMPSKSCMCQLKNFLKKAEKKKQAKKKNSVAVKLGSP